MFGRETYGESNDGTLMVLLGDKKFQKFGVATVKVLVAIRDGKPVRADKDDTRAMLALLIAFKLITEAAAGDHDITDAGRAALDRIATNS